MGIFHSTCSTLSMRKEEERQQQQVERQGQVVDEEERREATRELIRKTEKLEIFLQQRPSAAELIEKNIIPRSVIDAGEATWQVKKALVTEAVFVFLFFSRNVTLIRLSFFLSLFSSILFRTQVPDRKTSHSGAVAKRTRASKKRRETYSLRLSKTYHKPRDPVSILEEAMAPKKKEGRGGKAPAGTETNSGPTGRIAVGPFNIERLKAKLLRKGPRTQHSKMVTINEGEKNVNNDLERLQVHQQKMAEVKRSYLKDRKQEIKQKHSTSKKRFTPDTPGHVKFLHTKFRQVFQPFQSNPDKYADRNQTQTRSNQKAPKNVPTKD